MKIYASRQAYNIDNFIGKDIWVLADVCRFDGRYYIKLYSVSATGYIFYSAIPAECIDESDSDRFCTKGVLDIYFHKKYHCLKSSIKIVTPLDTYTEAEILEAFCQNYTVMTGD